MVQRQGSTSSTVPMTVEVKKCSTFRRVAEAGLHVPQVAVDS